MSDDARETLRRLYHLLEYGWIDADETLAEVEEIVSAWHYGDTYASVKATKVEKKIIRRLKKQRRKRGRTLWGFLKF